MQFPALIHLTRIVQAFAKGQEIVVLGSSSLLATYPDLGNRGNLLETSYDDDLLLADCDETFSQVLEDSLGAESLFQSQNGYHADILRPAITELLPRGWRERLVPLPDCAGVLCLEPHDLAVAKLQARRPKDLSLLAALLAAKMLDETTIRQRIDHTRLNDKMLLIIFRKLQEALEIAKIQP